MIVPRTFQRIAIVLMYGAYVSGAILQWQQHEIVSYPEQWIILGLFLFSFAVGAFLFALTHYMAWGAARYMNLDERERATRNAIYGSAYRIMAWSSLVLVTWWLLGSHVVQPRPFSVDANIIFWGYVLLIATLPASLLAWRDRPAA